MDVERGNEAVYIYMNSKALRRAKKVATGYFHLSNTEENALEDDIVAMLEAEAELVTNNEAELVTNDEAEDPTAVHNFM